MKNKELIKKLQQFPNDLEVCIFDWKKSVHNASEEPSSEGIEPEFNVEEMKEGTPFIALSFSNSDYEEN